MKSNVNVKKIALAGVMIAIGVACSMFYIPVGVVKCFPIQHAINILAAIILGPLYGVEMAFCTSLIRVLMGTGSLMAFPGSMIGAVVCGLVYKYTGNIYLTFLGELLGTGILGAIASYPVAAFLMGKEVALFGFVIPFSISALGGVIIAAVLVLGLRKANLLSHLQGKEGDNSAELK